VVNFRHAASHEPVMLMLRAYLRCDSASCYSKIARLNEDSRKSPADSHVLWYKQTETVILSHAVILSIFLGYSVYSNPESRGLLINTKFIFLWQHPNAKHSLRRSRWLFAVQRKEPEYGSFPSWYCELSIHTPLFFWGEAGVW